MSGWTTKKLGEVCESISTRGCQIQQNEICDIGKFPVVSQSEAFIEGYTDFENAIENIPVVLFGDHTCCVKYIDFPFVVGADGTKLLTAKQFEVKFLYYAILKISSSLVDGKYRRHFKDLKKCDIPIPPLAEQKRIVAKIDAAFEKIDRLKANAEKNLANAKELFQSALDEAMRPKKGWVEKRLGEIGSCKNGLNFKRAAEGEKIDIVGVSDFKKGLVVNDATELERLTLQELPEQEWYLHPNDIVFVRSNGSKALVGRAVIIKSKRPLTFSGFCIRYRIEDKRIDPDYLARIVSVESFRKAMLSGRNATTINNVTQPILLSQVISIPSLGEQKQIIKHLDFLSEKIKMLEQNYARQIADCAEMRQAILREAFEGRL